MWTPSVDNKEEHIKKYDGFVASLLMPIESSTMLMHCYVLLYWGCTTTTTRPRITIVVSLRETNLLWELRGGSCRAMLPYTSSRNQWHFISPQCGVQTSSWRGAISPPGHCRSSLEQGTEPLTASREPLYGSPSPTFACLQALCVWVVVIWVYMCKTWV